MKARWRECQRAFIFLPANILAPSSYAAARPRIRAEDLARIFHGENIRTKITRFSNTYFVCNPNVLTAQGWALECNRFAVKRGHRIRPFSIPRALHPATFCTPKAFYSQAQGKSAVVLTEADATLGYGHHNIHLRRRRYTRNHHRTPTAAAQPLPIRNKTAIIQYLQFAHILVFSTDQAGAMSALRACRKPLTPITSNYREMK